MTDNSYMFVDEDKEEISKAGGEENKGKYLDETITGEIEDDSTINLVADEDLISNSVALSPQKIETRGKGFGIASLVFGVISMSLFCSFINIFASIISIALGIVQLRRGEGRALAIVGIVFSIGSVVLLIICMNLIMSNEAFVNMILDNMNNMGIYNMV